MKKVNYIWFIMRFDVNYVRVLVCTVVSVNVESVERVGDESGC